MNNRILIAEDSPIISVYLKKMLGFIEEEFISLNQERDEIEHFSIEVFDDGDLLVDAFRTANKKGEFIPLFILDMSTIKMEGLNIAKEIRSIDNIVQIIIVTDFRNLILDEIKSQLSNDIYYLKKPFNEEEMTVLVQSLLKNWYSKHELQQLKKDIEQYEALSNSRNEEIEKLQKEKKQLINHLEDSKERDSGPDRLKTAFLLNMSHEIRTPMNAIVGFSDLLGDPDLTEDQREEFIELITNSGNDLLNLVDDIVDISRIDSGSFNITKEKFDLFSLFNELENKYVDELKLKKISNVEILNRKEIDDKDATIFSNEFRLRQIFTKLINNSMKYTKSGHIEIGVERKDESNLQFYVKDNGIGLSDIKQNQIFDLFSEYDNSYTKKYGGTRTGLHLAKKLTEMLGGKMWVESKLGEGATFYFTLPHDRNALQPVIVKEGKKPMLKIDWSDKVFLIAEDVEFNYMYLEEILQKTKVKILWAKNGQEALYFFETNSKIDLVLMDLQMPVMNGFEATREIKKKFPQVPIIVQTAYTIDEEREKSKKAGCDDFLSKPMKPSDLYESISKFI